MTKLIYKIQSTVTGLFSASDTTPKFNKKGKVWRDAGDVDSHLNQLNSVVRSAYLKNEVEIVTYEVREVKIGAISYEEKLKQIQQKVKAKDELIRLKNMDNNNG